MSSLVASRAPINTGLKDLEFRRPDGYGLIPDLVGDTGKYSDPAKYPDSASPEHDAMRASVGLMDERSPLYVQDRLQFQRFEDHLTDSLKPFGLDANASMEQLAGAALVMFEKLKGVVSPDFVDAFSKAFFGHYNRASEELAAFRQLISRDEAPDAVSPRQQSLPQQLAAAGITMISSVEEIPQEDVSSPGIEATQTSLPAPNNKRLELLLKAGALSSHNSQNNN